MKVLRHEKAFLFYAPVFVSCLTAKAQFNLK